ncbi:MAG: TetR/AcrR family transcriptional regulator [Acidimicrobiales bacterium]|nr:TetR/AcrR family transcriptional regulator [Acidimicrobiales bacterium]
MPAGHPRRGHGGHRRSGGPHEVDRRVARTTEAVVAAGRKLLDDEGPEAVTHLRISELTGIARTTIYRHWPDREALLEAVLAESTPPGEPIDTGDVETDLREFFRRLTTRARRGPDDSGFAHVVARAHRHRGFAEMRRQRMDRRLEPLRAILRRGVERGELRADLDLDDVAVDLVAPVFFRRFFLGETPSQERIDRAIHDFLARSRPM